MKALRSILLIGLLLWVASPLWSEDQVVGGLHCGDRLLVTASAQPGYRFVAWNDGNKENPRILTMDHSLTLEAVYEPNCENDPVVVVWLYSQLLLVDVDGMQRMGYEFGEEDVRWYKTVGEADYESGEDDDELVGKGFYIAHEDIDIHFYYVVVEARSTNPDKCGGTLYGTTYGVRRTLSTEANGQDIRLLPNLSTPGEALELVGLSEKEEYLIEVIDATGQRLEQYRVSEADQFTLVAQGQSGCYLVKVQSKDRQMVVKYIVK